MPLSRLDRTFKLDVKLIFPSYVINHPNNSNDIILISQNQNDIFTFQKTPGKFIISECKLTGKTSAEITNQIQQRLESPLFTNSSLIGFYLEDNGALHLGFFQHNDGKSVTTSWIVKNLGTGITSEKIKRAISEESGNIFKACIYYKGESYLIMEYPQTQVDIVYYVVEYPPQEINQPGFEAGLASKIDLCISKQDLKFAGMAIGSNSLFLIFAQ